MKKQEKTDNSFQLIKGASISDYSELREAYQIHGNRLDSNISAENIPRIFEAFLDQMREDEPLYLFIEAPCREDDEWKLNSPQSVIKHSIEKFHRDVYYLDGYNREAMLMFLHSGVGELLINDGFVYFGFGSLDSHIELGKYKYNVLTGYLHGQAEHCLSDVFDKLCIPRVSKLITAWQFFSDDNPGICRKYEFEGKDIYALIDQMKELGMYKAETREE